MGLSSDFFIADKTDSPEYDSGPNYPSGDRCQLRDITPLEAAGILSVLCGGDRIELLGAFPLLTDQEAEEWTMGVPKEMVTALAALSKTDIPGVATRSADMTAEELGWAPDDFVEVISQLVELAQRATESDRSMYLWNSL